ncbi:MAG TPA: type V CRISPR-associated protein Cas4 [Candidatus Spyradosoma merdigallinarum]|uniref:Type V CRISPR-associated protein Cas4 n=1 Tax=Candidatus Spyradosoma merdigallinarum TaxID=2840950 RepID=A0A9D1T1C8_9BACT|nr:type V CRISPR-associated protein Cas4 [Candidatus Spyradosoma merdigallinarum]
METYLTMTQINDFIFCPRSIYFHDIFRENTDAEFYRQTPQKRGLAAHEAIDAGTYSSRADVLAGTTVYCEKYKLVGRIDIFDTATGTLTERKYSVTALYDGFVFQLYAQMFALREMGCDVRALRLYSKKDNKIYPVPLPGHEETARFERTLEELRAFSPEKQISQNPKKCARCIYAPLCDIAPTE